MEKQTYLALTSQDLGLESRDIEGVTYAPGLVCTDCLKPLNIGLLVRMDGQLDLLGESCAYMYKPRPWVDAIRSRRYFLSRADCQQDAQLPPSQRRYFRSLALYVQIYPGLARAQQLFEVLRQSSELEQQLRWDIERLLLPITKVNELLQRRDQIVRLGVLSWLGGRLEEEHRKVQGLLQQVRMEGLSIRQNAMLWALQAKFGEQLLPYSKQFLAFWPPQGGAISVNRIP